MHRGGDGAALHLRSSGRIAPAGPPPTRALSVTAAFASHLRTQGGEGTYPLPVVFRQKKRRHFWISSTEIFDGDYAGVKGGTVEEGVGVEAPWE